MGGVIVGGVLALAAVALAMAGAVVLIRATSDATARAQVLGIRAADRAEPGSVYDPEPPRVLRAPARRLAVDPPEVPGVHVPLASPEAEPARPFQGW